MTHRALRRSVTLVAGLAMLSSIVATPVLAAAPASAADIATAIDVDPAVLVSTSLGTSDPNGAGTHSGSLGVAPNTWPQQGTSFGILSTGLAASADDPDSNQSETLAGNTADDKSATLGGQNNAAGHDMVTLTLVLNAPVDTDCLLFRFAFFSEEFPDWVGEDFNDTFTAELNGSNIAFDSNGNVIDVNTNFGFDPSNLNPNTGTTYDGTTGLLEAAGPVAGGSTNTLVFRIQDLGDSILDSAVFLDYLRFVYTGDACEPGAQPVAPTLELTPETATNGVRTSHTVTASVKTGPFPVTSKPVVFTVAGANPQTASTVLTDVAGDAAYTWSGTATGVDTVTAFLDVNGNGTREATETAVDTATKTWVNSAPTITITSPSDGDLVGMVGGTAVVTTTANVSDPDVSEVLSCSTTWDDGSAATAVVATGNPGTCTTTHTYTTPGVYTIETTVTDILGLTASDSVMIVVYDPDGPFVTGGGWITSPAGAYADDPTLSGRATFGFVSKYKPGATTPTGSTEFQFQLADLNFHSTSYQWLVVSGARAQYKGTGTINGEPGYSFLLTAVDGSLSGGGGVDRFRIKIWETASGDIVYDNNVGLDDEATPTTLLGSGNIVIHKK